jgi:DNA uptake protein ComE-like DNA-binding protein
MSVKKEKERGALSQSFVMGAISLVFLVIGYQTALLIHNSALTRIAANRDAPDTVFIYKETAPAAKNPSAAESTSMNVRTAERRNAEHSPRVEAVRKNLPRKKVESFTFNPNTVSVEDLCRLGLSSSQADAIDSYRKKGGRFNRKTDFAESYVVSDSIYRRLEPYIHIPLTDLNLADSAAFDALPGIGGWYASKIIEHRKRLKGYSYKEQLMDIQRFDEQKYEKLCDLVIVSEEHVKPYPLWELPADSLRLHPYIGDYAAEGIVLFRENNPKQLWTIEGLKKAGVLNPGLALKLERCHIRQP